MGADFLLPGWFIGKRAEFGDELCEQFVPERCKGRVYAGAVIDSFEQGAGRSREAGEIRSVMTCGGCQPLVSCGWQWGGTEMCEMPCADLGVIGFQSVLKDRFENRAVVFPEFALELEARSDFPEIMRGGQGDGPGRKLIAEVWR